MKDMALIYFLLKEKKFFTPKDEKVLNGVVRHFIEIISKKITLNL